MTPKTVRFGRRALGLIEREADRDGSSFSVYVREAAIVRAIYSVAERATSREAMDHRLADLREQLTGIGLDGSMILELILARVDEAVNERE